MDETVSNWCEVVEKAAYELGVTITRKICDQFKIHVKELLVWNEKMNLTAITDPMEIAIKHFVDSSILASYIEKNQRMLDMGSGGGFPGLVIGVQRPDVKITLVDASRKKVAFLQHVIRKLGLINTIAIHARIEKMGQNERFDVITCRAFASLDEIVHLAKFLLSSTGSILAMRGYVTQEEEKNIRKNGLVQKFKKIEYQLPIENAKRTLVQIRLFEK